MTKTAAAFLSAGALTLVAGVALWSVPAAVCLAGLLLIAAGVLSIERPDPKSEARL